MKKTLTILLILVLCSLGCNKDATQQGEKQAGSASGKGGGADPRKVNEAGEEEKTPKPNSPKKEPAKAPEIAQPQESAKPQPKILQEKTWTWEGSKDNYAKYTDLVFEVGIGDERNGVGCADAGVEIENVRTIRLSVEAPPSLKRHDDNSFAGFMVDYHTSDGYTKRVALSVGMYSESGWTKTPVWGKFATPNQFADLGTRQNYHLQLDKWAPNGWDGKVWFTVSLQNTGRNTSLKAKAEFLSESVKPAREEGPVGVTVKIRFVFNCGDKVKENVALNGETIRNGKTVMHAKIEAQTAILDNVQANTRWNMNALYNDGIDQQVSVELPVDNRQLQERTCTVGS